MISDLAYLFSSVQGLFQTSFTIYGLTFSLWEVFLFDIVAFITLWFLREVFF